MEDLKLQFSQSSSSKTLSYILIGIGALALIAGFIFYGTSKSEDEQNVFIGTLMYNSIFWTLVTNASMFFICVTTLAMGGWQQTFRRIPEAISTLVPVFGTITLTILLFVVLSGRHSIYHWLDVEEVMKDPILKGKSGFLNPVFYTVWSLLAVGLWSFLGFLMRKLSSEADISQMDYSTGYKFIFQNTVRGSMFLAWFGLTVGSTIPWLWIMSLDPHWYSTMFSWYTFASSFVSGISLIALWLVYLKNKGYMELSNEEHLHDLGKFMFAFSIFWTYLWFSQYMLIWYANIPEETIYFKHRVQGPYRGIFFFNLIVNFLCPLLILLKRNIKRNYTMITLMGCLIIFGHWIDFYQMVMGSISKTKVTLCWLDFGILSFFVGLVIFLVSKALASKPLIPKYHPFLKESIIHHT